MGGRLRGRRLFRESVDFERVRLAINVAGIAFLLIFLGALLFRVGTFFGALLPVGVGILVVY